jgi:hypothetical protein
LNWFLKERIITVSRKPFLGLSPVAFSSSIYAAYFMKRAH